MVCIHTENLNQGDVYLFTPLEVLVLYEFPSGHLHDGLTDVPALPNSPPENVFNQNRPVFHYTALLFHRLDYPPAHLSTPYHMGADHSHDITQEENNPANTTVQDPVDSLLFRSERRQMHSLTVPKPQRSHRPLRWRIHFSSGRRQQR